MEPAPDNFRPDSEATRQLLDLAAAGDTAALEKLLARFRPDLVTFADLHLDHRLAARIDASDIVQEAQAVLVRRFADFLGRRPMPFHLWARKTVYERLVDARRRHLSRARRSVGRERLLPSRSSLLLVRPLIDRGPSPSHVVEAKEFEDRVARAIESLPDADREVLLLRHAEGLPFGEIGSLLGIEPAALRKRFGAP